VATGLLWCRFRHDDSGKEIEASPRQAAGRLHRKDDNFLDIRSLTPQQATGNVLAYAVQEGSVCRGSGEGVVNRVTQPQSFAAMLCSDLFFVFDQHR
jgi:hypothetical protein